MKWIDIIAQAFSNLMRRKLRSGLTMLGVVIGTAAIVVTISLGYGAEETQMAALEGMSNLRMITISPRYGSSTNSNNRRITKITDGVVSQIRKVAGVEAVTPIMYLSLGPEAYFMTGKFESYASVIGVFPRDFAKIQGLKAGRYFSSNTNQLEFIMSEMTMMEFSEPGEDNYFYYWDYAASGEPLPLPKIDWLHARYELQLRWEEDNESTDVDAEALQRTQDIRARMIGYIDANNNSTDMFIYGAIVNIDWVKRYYRENRNFLKEYGITKPIEEYSQLYALADSVDNVTRVLRDIEELGLSCYSNLSQLEQMRGQIRTMQGFLGFIGMISMLVAALSIANTMMMSIYERTREIGVMKVLGCKLNNIRVMFLSEAAFIGLIGGALGLVVSYSLSYALNNVESLRRILSSVMSSTDVFNVSGEASRLSIIPIELALTTWLGVAAVSILSGVQPAQRAMNLSSLAAIRASD